MSIGGVALAVALMVIVTGIGVGIASQSTIYGDDVDYWVTPETDGSSSALVNADNTRFGAVHPTAASVAERDDVEYASPVLTQVIRIESTGEHAEYVLAVGIVAQPQLTEIADVTTDGLTHGDPYFESDEWTGEMVLSSGAAELLAVDHGDSLEVTRPRGADDREFTVTSVDSGDRTGSQFPVAVMQLSELQAITGADSNDEADQIVVSTTNPGVEAVLADLYPRSTVSAQSGLNAQNILADELPLALSLTAVIIAVVIGTLFVMTTTGLSVAADRGRLATLAAIGISARTRFRLLATEILAMTLVGGLIGVALGLVGIRVVNIVARETISSGDVASTEPFIIVFGIAVAGVIGLLTLPYLAVLLSRVGTETEVGQ